jgi:CHAT domain-containing protein
VEEHALSYLVTGRELIRYAAAGAAEGTGEAVLGYPDYHLAPLTQTAEGPAGENSSSRRSADLGVLSFNALPGTREEAERIGELLGTQPLVGAKATETALKGLQSPRVLHIATHGFFLEDQEREPVAATVLATEGGPLGARGGPDLLGGGAKLENPLLRSGLALAGANRWQEAAAAGQSEDGLLTALEAAGLHLRGTELVVLSACETGLGEVRQGEGVFGLRRSFLQAGARTLLMSLWRVPDEETVELMEGFYGRWLPGMGKAEALRESQLALIRSLRERDGFAHPFFWAGFVLTGDWR